MTFTMGPAILFCPADRPDRYAKAAERADAVILDLEDAVDPARNAVARAALREHPLDPGRTIVRVNGVDSGELDADLAAVRATGYRTLMVPKATERLDLFSGFSVIALCETAAGVLAAAEIAAHPDVVALMWGAEDLVASLGGTSSRAPGGRYRDVARHARSQVLLAAKAQGIAAIDAVHLEIEDRDGLEREATDAAASGFDAVACIHPRQVATIRAAFVPTPGEVAFAREVIEAASSHTGVFRFRGSMVDEPVLRHAEAVLGRAGEARHPSASVE